MFIDIEKKKCLVAGGGTVALRKVRVLLDFGAQVMVWLHRLTHRSCGLQEMYV